MIFMSKDISWDDQRCFLAVLEEGSLSAAARKLGVSQPTVRARISSLEESLGTPLFTRSVNGLAPTETARELHKSAKAMAMASADFIRKASAPPDAIAGTVRLSVPEVMGTEVIPTMLATLQDRHPAIHIELELSNKPADILQQEVDLAVRTVQPKQEALVARKVASIPLGFFASPAYLAKHGTPLSMEDLSRHHFVGPDRSLSDLALAKKLGLSKTTAKIALATDSHPAQLAAARAGLGIAVIQVPFGSRHSDLVHILKDQSVYALGTWVVTHENLRAVPRIRAVFDCLVEGFTHYR